MGFTIKGKSSNLFIKQFFSLISISFQKKVCRTTKIYKNSRKLNENLVFYDIEMFCNKVVTNQVLLLQSSRSFDVSQ